MRPNCRLLDSLRTFIGTFFSLVVALVVVVVVVCCVCAISNTCVRLVKSSSRIASFVSNHSRTMGFLDCCFVCCRFAMRRLISLETGVCVCFSRNKNSLSHVESNGRKSTLYCSQQSNSSHHLTHCHFPLCALDAAFLFFFFWGNIHTQYD
jgi:hypothetical protein